MNWNDSSVENLRRVFTESFVARDIAEPLASFDASTSALQVLQFMRSRDFDVVGVRKDGLVVGCVARDDLGAGACGDSMQTLDADTCVSDTLSLSDVVAGLAHSPRLYVRTLGAIGGIITMSDLQKPPFRMWLFGIISLIEMRTTRLIELKCEAGSWKQFLSESRLQKAQELLEERIKRNQDLELIDCLQMADKGQIIARNEEIRNLTLFQSRRQAEQAIRMIEGLRNSLAHSQDIVASDWETIVLLCQDMERVVTGTEAVRKTLGEPR